MNKEGPFMADIPGSLSEFQQWFPDNAACAAYLARKRWPPIGESRFGLDRPLSTPFQSDDKPPHNTRK